MKVLEVKIPDKPVKQLDNQVHVNQYLTIPDRLDNNNMIQMGEV
jgi:hypothetical protein